MNEKLWTDDINSLFKEWAVFPTENMTKEEKLNAITRLVIAVSVVLLLFGKKDISLYVLLIGLLLVIVINSQNQIENFEFDESDTGNEEGMPSSGGRAPIYTCNVTYYPTLVSGNSANIIHKNSALSGPQNPKTLIPPPIAPPLADLDTWKANEWTTHSHINSRTVQDEDETGPFSTIGYGKSFLSPEFAEDINYLTSYGPDQANNPCYRRYLTRTGMGNEMGFVEPFQPPATEGLIKDLSEDEPKLGTPSGDQTVENFINEIQPGIYVSSKDKPILDNEGLLDPEQPQGRTTLYTPIINGNPRDGLQIYVEDDEPPVIAGITTSGYHGLERAYRLPQRYVRERLPKRYGEWNARESTIPGIPFGTRVGYGVDTEGVGGRCNFSDTRWRAGTEQVKDLSGQEEMSEYYNKNKLDMFEVDPTAPLYEINKNAVQLQIEVTNRFRSDMQESLMRKINAEAWARKEYPLDTNHRRMLGGTGQF
ncbi:hypothetical protein IIV31_041L [Armadillidium vulgare iridescent virus]|uniref:Minor capsid protein P9 transmembrane helices domain-containing protein n=1 Tax=Armadillidium vulgare iridescent virus TaxID=72201 RepID=A0A068QKQ3_9VIRU|nr:hypothetical protein IIV31_041L [Armadillidium vulgare iridescent virus]CCV02413.1 hypothetical protein IIV31_041L [Armadillidium vulgare iridescent virus]